MKNKETEFTPEMIAEFENGRGNDEPKEGEDHE